MLGEFEAEAYLEQIGKSGCILGLESMERLMEELGEVHKKIPYIHVAGTNGKGSVCAMLSTGAGRKSERVRYLRRYP